GRLSFWRFGGLPLDQRVPEFSTFWRFHEELLAGDERAAFGDKAYASKDLEIQCRSEKTYYEILEKATRNNPLSSSQESRNERNRRVRRSVEHLFAAIKQRYWSRVANAKKQDSQPGTVHYGHNLLEHRTLHQLGSKSPKATPGRAL